MKIRHLNHSTYQHLYHIVWGTKARRNYLKPYVVPVFKQALFEVCKKYPTLFVQIVNTDEDHVHMQLEVPPNISVSDAVRALKAHSSSVLRKRFKFIKQMYLEKDGIWSVGYFSSTNGLNDAQVRRYIEWQGKNEQPKNLRLF